MERIAADEGAQPRAAAGESVARVAPPDDVAAPDRAVDVDADRAPWARLIRSAQSPERAAMALAVMRRLDVKVTGATAADASVLVWASGCTRDHPDSEGLVTPVQAARALQRLAALTHAERGQLRAVLAGVSPGVHAVVLKALAARGGVSFAEVLPALTQLAQRLRGLSHAEVVRRTSAYALAGDDAVDARKQQLENSCGPNVRRLAAAEIDPILALELHANPNAARADEVTTLRAVLNPGFWARLLRTVPDGGTTLSTYLHTAFDGLGVGFVTVDWRSFPTKAEALDVLADRVREGLDAPLRVTEEERGHFAIIVDVSTLQGKRAWRVHDPRSGATEFYSDAALLSGTVCGGVVAEIYAPYAG